jgi:23S rRNA pseudouridine1911/1915/1917 synthase
MCPEQNQEHHQVTAGEDDAGERLDRMLAARLEGLSRSRLKALIEAGMVSTGGATINEPSSRVKPGQTFAIVIPETIAAHPEGQALALEIVYEDRDIIVVDKAAGMVVHPAPGNPDKTLVNALIAHCGSSLAGIGGVRRPGIVHRLDKDTSGLIVAAKTDAAHQGLVAQFADRSVERAYSALVWGLPNPAKGEISGNIGRNPRNRKKMAVLKRGGRPAVTRYQVKRSLAGGAASLIECRLLTGRTHQIRVHLAHLGHPLLGDGVYGKASPLLARHFLHANLLGFQHPRTGEALEFQAELPPDLAGVLDDLRSGSG